MTSGDIAVLANPTAGRGRHRGLLPGVLQRLGAAGHTVRLLEAGGAEEAEKACHRAVADGCAALVAVGGDGTVHLALQAAASRPVAFGVVPAGTGNDFAAGVGVPADPAAAASGIATALRDGTSVPIDLARTVGTDGETRWFGAVLAAGFDAIVNERANRMRFPRGPRRYDVAIVAELLRLRPRRYRITLDGRPHEWDAVLVAVGNTLSYGGGMRICPDADAGDGLLDLVVVGPISRTTLVRIKPRVYAGTHVTHPAVATYRAASIRLEAEGITTYVDGERSAALPVTVTAVPGALRLLTRTHPAG